MAEIVIAPNGTDAIEIGGFHDDSGNRFVGLNFKMPNGDNALITFALPLFEAYAKHVGHAASNFATEQYWRSVRK